MKVKFYEGKFGTSIDLEPENLQEASALARMTLNAKSTKPEINHYFSESGQSCSVWIKSVHETVRKTSISNAK